MNITIKDILFFGFLSYGAYQQHMLRADMRLKYDHIIENVKDIKPFVKQEIKDKFIEAKELNNQLISHIEKNSD